MNHNGNEENNHITYITAFLRIPMGIYPDGTFFIRGQYDISYEVDGDDDDQQNENENEDKIENNEPNENDEPHDDNENEQNKDSDKNESIPIETNNLEEILGGAFLQLFGQGGGETSLLSSSSSTTTTTSSPVFVSKGDIKPRIFPKLHTNNKNKTFRMKRSVEAACGKSAFMKK